MRRPVNYSVLVKKILVKNGQWLEIHRRDGSWYLWTGVRDGFWAEASARTIVRGLYVLELQVRKKIPREEYLPGWRKKKHE